MRVRFTCFPDGKNKALTMSYDDGRIHDRRLVRIFDQFGIKGTFHLNGGTLDRPGFLFSNEIPVLFHNHEVSCHSLTHPFLENVPAIEAVTEMIEDRRILEAQAGYPMRGMSYPFGTYNDDVTRLVRSTGMEYARTTKSTFRFQQPDDFLAWHPTCHHAEGLSELLEKFNSIRFANLQVFYVWGHSYEFNDNDNWDLIEDFCGRASKLDDVWFATNIEIVDYMNALKSLRCTVDMRTIHNPTATTVWVDADGTPVEIKGGETKTF